MVQNGPKWSKYKTLYGKNHRAWQVVRSKMAEKRLTSFMDVPSLIYHQTKLINLVVITTFQQYLLTDSIFETGAYKVPCKSQNSTVLGQGDPSTT